MKSPQFLEKLQSIKDPLVIRRIQGHSMMPVLPPGTVVWANRWFKKDKLKEGDVIIFQHEGKEKIKRVCDLSEAAVYVLGDHSETSTDSRHFGWVRREDIIAKAFWPHAPKDRAEHVHS